LAASSEENGISPWPLLQILLKHLVSLFVTYFRRMGTMRTHPLEHDLNADASDILSAIQKGFRTIIDVKGKLAEYFLLKEIQRLKRKGLVAEFVWTDKDGQPDFLVECQGHPLKIECKNIRSRQLFRSPPSYRIELQKTRNSKDGTNTRGSTK